MYNELFRKKLTSTIKCCKSPDGCYLTMKQTGRTLTSKSYSDVIQRTEKCCFIIELSLTAIIQNIYVIMTILILVDFM